VVVIVVVMIVIVVFVFVFVGNASRLHDLRDNRVKGFDRFCLRCCLIECGD
jgi:hypothetical protein